MNAAQRALEATRAGRWDDAADIVRRLVTEAFGLEVDQVTIGRDHYSLNSVNGFLDTRQGADYFFKFHHEEGEEQTLKEFYRGEVLKSAGYPIDMPLFVSREPGRQILLYARRKTPRLADVCLDLEWVATSPAAPESRGMPTTSAVLAAQASLDDLTRDIYLATWHRTSPKAVAAEPIHQLFHRRLESPDQPGQLGGRARRFFWGADFPLGAITISAQALRGAAWRINGVAYRDSIETLLERSLALLEPSRLASAGAVTAHGDAHNANVWYEPAALTLFDPAFAGTQVPALLAEVKATFHNCLAHPLWLYNAAAAAARYAPTVRFEHDVIDVDLAWALSPLRLEFLDSKARRVWRPLLTHLAAQGCLPADWRPMVRCALFCCPALVMELRAAPGTQHNAISSLIGLSVAVMAGSAPAGAETDCISRFLDAIDPARPTGPPP